MAPIRQQQTANTDSPTITFNNYDITSTTGGHINVISDYITSSGTNYTVVIKKENGQVNPVLVFKLMKRKLCPLLAYEKYKRRIKKLEELFYKYVELNHEALSLKFLKQMEAEVRISEAVGMGIKETISIKLVNKYRDYVKNGKLSVTDFDNYTRVIPDKILEFKKKLDEKKIFSRYDILHYWNEEAEKKKEEKETSKMSDNEREKMKDPILFGIMDELPDTYFHIGSWIDEYCDLTFSKLIDCLPVEIDPKIRDLKSFE